MSLIPASDPSRRKFVQQLGGGAALVALAPWRSLAGEPSASPVAAAGEPGADGAKAPWYRRCQRWGQTNLTEIDPQRFDLAWWRGHWRDTGLDGIVVNAGGIVAYYPTQVPYHRRAAYLGDRDLFGDILGAAHEDGLAVFARMDSHRADEAFYRAHPDWFAVDADGKPYRQGGLFIACVNGPYYHEHIPAILREVATRYRPEGFTDNNWNGPMRHQPCFCANCERSFRARSGRPIPRAANRNDPVYRNWIAWNYERRLEIWDDFNRVTRAAGGADCIWVGMMAGSQDWQARVFRDDREIYRRTELIMLDDQHRQIDEGFQHNGEIGKRLRAVGGWDKIIPESMAMYALTEHAYRFSSNPEPEARLWVVEGIAGGVQPWWHHIGSDQQDRRMLATAGPLWRWHRDHQEYLINRRPVATVGLVWSRRNMDYFGRDDAGPLVRDPWNGWMQALVRARIPYVPVHVDDLDRVVAEIGLRTLVLPNLGAMTDAQAAAIRKFVTGGGGLVATGLSSLCRETGEAREDFALADLFGAHVPAEHPWRDDAKRAALARDWTTSYLRLEPELRGVQPGPRSGDEPAVVAPRPDVLRGLDGTDILGFGGELHALTLDADVTVPMTYVPPVPAQPVEAAWMNVPRTDIPGLVLNERAGRGRVAYLAADLDRLFAREYLPDHGAVLANLVRWTLRDEVPLRVEGPGLIDCQLHRQPGRLVLHLVNLTNPGAWRAPVHELIPVGPLRVSVRLPDDVAGRTVRSLVQDATIAMERLGGSVAFTIKSLLDHEVLAIM